MTGSITLVLWLWMGARFEETQVPNLRRSECYTLMRKVRFDEVRGVANAQCLRRDGEPAICDYARRLEARLEARRKWHSAWALAARRQWNLSP